EAKKAFDYAAAIGVKTVVAVPTEEKEIEVDGKKKKVRFHSRARCEYLAGLCKEYDMRIAIHNHGPDIPYCFPTGESAFNMVKDLDPLYGRLPSPRGAITYVPAVSSATAMAVLKMPHSTSPIRMPQGSFSILSAL
ncbi:MAG: hypothetical protein IKD97_04190, partial [Firmicutes bacterium]|nr:hypothetical protein [Bacillota bacterium]